MQKLQCKWLVVFDEHELFHPPFAGYMKHLLQDVSLCRFSDS